MTTSFKLPTSIGISFYIASSTKAINIDVKWGDYVRSVEKRVGKDGKEFNHASYTRQPMVSTIVVDFDSFEKNTKIRLQEDSNIIVHISRIPLKTGYSLVTAYVMNRRKNSENEVESMMFQVELKAYLKNGERVFPKRRWTSSLIKKPAQRKCMTAQKRSSEELSRRLPLSIRRPIKRWRSCHWKICSEQWK